MIRKDGGSINMKTILCLQSFTEQQRESLRQAAPGMQVIFGTKESLEDRHYREAEIICGWNNKVKEQSLQENAKLRWVQSGSSGVDYLPLSLLEQRGIRLTDASGVHAVSVSETVLAMMLGLSRGIASAVRNQQNAVWDSPPSLAEVNGGTVAIIGAGSIGREVARLARAFNMRIIGVTRSGISIPETDVTLDTSRLNEALNEADFIINILPYTNETFHLFDASRFALMKKSAYFINVGRGATVRTDDLVAALHNGTIAGAGLDVFEQEPLPEKHPLWNMPNVILTPHNAGGGTDRNKERLAKLFELNLSYYLSGELSSLHNLVDYRKQY
jgi:D-2-hydroxyacid dehydrogenase (NADP+)